MTVKQAVNAEEVTPVTMNCSMSCEVHVAARQGLERWRANDPALMAALRVGNQIIFMETLIWDVEQEMEAVAACTDDMAHHMLVSVMAGLDDEAAAIAALHDVASEFGLPRVDMRRLAPFLGASEINAEEIPEHIARTLDALGIRRHEYLSWRKRGAKPRRKNIDYNFRMMEEERAKLLRTVHAVAAADAGLVADPEVGPEPATATERALLDGADLQKVLEYLAGPVSGHAFRAPSFLEDIGLRSHVARVVVRKFKSDLKNPMYTIFGAGGAVLKSVVAVKELELLWLLANETGADVREASTKYGRGTRAQLLAAAIRDAIGH